MIFGKDFTHSMTLPSEGAAMPLYMDIHRDVDGLTPEALKELHQRDVVLQHRHGVQYLQYWYNVGEGAIFCLCRAPSKEAAESVHREAHGGIADEIIEVEEGLLSAQGF